MNKKNKRNYVTAAFILAIVAIYLLVVKIIDSRVFKVEENTLKREISYTEMLRIDKEPTGRDVCWDSELPNFIKEDMEYCKEREYEIKYEIGYTNINIRYYDSEWYLSVYPPSDYSYMTMYDYSNFSIYKTDKSEIVIYGYSDFSYFDRIVIDSEGKPDDDTIAYDLNIPFSLEDKESSRYLLNGYSLLWDKDKYVFYKEGKKISTSHFKDVICKDIDSSSKCMITTNNELYLSYIQLKDGKPYIDFIYVDTIDSMNGYEHLIDVNKEFLLPIIIKDDKYYTIKPENWDTYNSFDLEDTSSKKINKEDYEVSLVELKTVFKEADFWVSDNDIWVADVIFEVNGYNFKIDYQINGYDDSVDLPEEVAKKYEIKVTSVEEFWENIQNIRIAYFDYYDQAEDY